MSVEYNKKKAAYDHISYDQLLINHNLITKQQLAIAREEQILNKQSLRIVLLKMGLLREDKLVECLINNFNYENFQLDLLGKQSYKLLQKIGSENAYKHKIVPIKLHNSNVSIAFADVLDIKAQDFVQKTFTKTQIKIYVSTEKNILDALDILHKPQQKTKVLREENNFNSFQFTTNKEEKCERELFIQEIILAAIREKASDIHFEPEEAYVKVRLRIAGVLVEHNIFHIHVWSNILSKLKIMSNMNIAETRLPQYGRFTKYIIGRDVDFRASCHPTCSGENFVIRVLDRMHTFLELDELGFEKKQIAIIKRQLQKPYGIFIITGPTGSGKTTSLYSMLSYLKSHEKNIMTLEDPIEYRLYGIRQTQINQEIGFDFAYGVKSILRQDPDIILIGEIRDKDTATMALRAAMTGHLVLATLHTNSALTAANRLIDLGVQPAALSGNINCVLSQRLVRVKDKSKYGTEFVREPIVEILEVSPEMDTLITTQQSQQKIYKQACKDNYIPMQEYAQKLLDSQIASKPDVEKVIPLK